MGALEIIRLNASSIRGGYHLRRIGVFGSCIRGENTSRSDVDVLVEFEPGYETFDNYMELKYRLEALVGSKVDLVTADALKPQLRDIILNEVAYA